MYNNPFYFAIAHGTPTAERAQVPQRVRQRFGITGGQIEFVNSDDRMRLYRIVGGR